MPALRVGVDGCMAAVMVVPEFVAVSCLRANNALNIKDKMGIFLYIAPVSDLMDCAQTRSHGRSNLKCKSEMQ